jgi:oligopeptide transport system permease protein
MLTFIIRRLLWAIPVLFFVALVSFFLMHQAPGGPFDKDNDKRQLDPATLKALNARFGLDKPAYFNPTAFQKALNEGQRNPITLGRTYLDSQFFNYVFGALRGDLGPSYKQRGRSVQDILIQRWPFSARLGILALGFALVIGIPLGILAALRQNSRADYISLFFATIGVSVPSFVIGLMVIIVFGTMLKWISISTNDWNSWRPYLAPAMVLALPSMSFIMRITRATMLDVKRQDYIRTARAKGLSEQRVIWRHMLRNGLIPVITVIGPLLVDLITGAVIIEAIFGIPGTGRFFVESIFNRDYSMIMGTTLVYATLIVLANIAVDLSYGVLDPRIRAQG